MSIEVQFYTVVIRREALDHLPDSARAAFYSEWGSDDLFREDEHLAATGFMGPADVDSFLDRMEELGLRIRDETGAFLDVAVVQEGFGIPLPCSWLALSWEPRSMEETRKEIQEMFGGGSIVIQTSQRMDGPPSCWHRDFHPGPLAEIPFLKAKPEQRSGNDYVIFPSGAPKPDSAKESSE